MYTIFLILLSSIVFAIPIFPNADEECINNICKRNIYSYDKYYYNGSRLLFLNESFNQSHCDAGYQYCVIRNKYQVNIKNSSNALNPVKFTRSGESIFLTPVKMYYENDQGQQDLIGINADVGVFVDQNQIMFQNIFGSGINLSLVYRHDTLKELISIESNTTLSKPKIRNVISVNVEYKLSFDNIKIYTRGSIWNRSTVRLDQLKFKRNNSFIFGISSPIAYDKRQQVNSSYRLEERGPNTFLTIITEIEFFNVSRSHRMINMITNVTFNKSLPDKFPKYIDPTVIIFDFNNFTYDAWIVREDAGTFPEMITFTRTINEPAFNFVGRVQECDANCTACITGNKIYRMTLDFPSILNLPGDIKILQGTILIFTVFGTVYDGHQDIEVHEMNQNITVAPEPHYLAMGNETIWNISLIPTDGSSVALWDISLFGSHYNRYTKGGYPVGFRSVNEDGPVSGCPVSTQNGFASNNFPLVGFRPLVAITYQPNENKLIAKQIFLFLFILFWIILAILYLEFPGVVFGVAQAIVAFVDFIIFTSFFPNFMIAGVAILGAGLILLSDAVFRKDL